MTKQLERSIAQESQARFSGDDYLQRQINALLERIKALESRMFKLENKGDHA